MATISTDSTFRFISDDVRRQLELSRELFKQAVAIEDEIKRLKEGAGDQQLVATLRDTRDNLLITAKDLASNATTTSTTAASVITSVTAKSST